MQQKKRPLEYQEILAKCILGSKQLVLFDEIVNHVTTREVVKSSGIVASTLRKGLLRAADAKLISFKRKGNGYRWTMTPENLKKYKP